MTTKKKGGKPPRKDGPSGNGHGRGHARPGKEEAAPKAGKQASGESQKQKALPPARALVPRSRAVARTALTLVTGGTGFLGAHLLEHLLARGAGPLRVVTTGAPKWLSELGVEVIEGSLTSPEVCARAVAGVRHIFHLAGKVSRDPDQQRAMYEVHVDATRHLLEAAARAGTERVVLAGTSGTIAVTTDGKVTPDESSPEPTDIISRWPYYASKAYQDRVARGICAQANIELVTVHPSLLLGPGDARLSSTEDVLRFLGKKIPTLPSGGVSFVDVRDCAAAVAAAMALGKPGERYLVGGHNMTFEEFFGRLERVSGVRAPWLKLPTRWVKPAARFMERLYEAFDRAAPVDAESAEMGEFFWYTDSQKARTELEFCPRDPTETLADTVRYVRERFMPDGGAFLAKSAG